MVVNNINLSALPKLSELFRIFTSGKHLNRSSEAALWYELEQNRGDYIALFKALNYELEIDARGFAWFNNEELTQTVNAQSRKLALFFMVIFDQQADTGQSLGAFCDWTIDVAFLESAHQKHKALFEAEGIEQEGFLRLVELAARNGFAIEEVNHWRLLPAVYRYLDHFEAIVEHSSDELSEIIEEME